MMGFIVYVGLIIASFYFVITRTAQEARPLRNIENLDDNMILSGVRPSNRKIGRVINPGAVKRSEWQFSQDIDEGRASVTLPMRRTE